MIETTTPSISEPEPPPPPRPTPYHDVITRYAAAAAHVNPWLCTSILVNFFARPRCAWGPSIGVDALGVVRHAVEARRRRRIRDALLMLILLGAAATILARMASRHGFRPTILTCAVLAGLAAVAWAARGPLHRLTSRTWSDLRKKPRTMLWAGIAVLAVVALLVSTAVRWPGLMTDVAIAAGAFLTAWAVLLVSAFLSLRRATIVRDAIHRTTDLARPLKPDVEDRLRELSDANVVVYGEGRADLPFLGSGQRIRTWKFEIDVTRGATGAAGERMQPVAFGDVEVNRHLDESFIGDQSDQMTCVHRLYIDGRTEKPVADDPDEWHGYADPRLPHPVQYLSQDRILEEVRRPRVDEYRRVYFCLQQVDRSGEIVVSVFVRPHIHGRLLYLEIAMHALFPLNPVIINQVRNLSVHPVDRLSDAARRGTRRLFPMIFGSFARTWREGRYAMVRARRRRLAQRAVSRQRPFDFGANITLREGISTEDVEELHYNAIMDVVSIGASLQNRLLSVLREFLVKHRVDITDFDQTKQSIVTTIQTWNVGQVKAEMVGFGNNNDFTNNPPASSDGDAGRSGDDKGAKP